VNCAGTMRIDSKQNSESCCVGLERLVASSIRRCCECAACLGGRVGGAKLCFERGVRILNMRIERVKGSVTPRAWI
jgi:hypothetical protein